MAIKMSKMAHFKSVTVWVEYLNTSKRSYLALSEHAMDSWILSYQ